MTIVILAVLLLTAWVGTCVALAWLGWKLVCRAADALDDAFEGFDPDYYSLR